jgi:hypothetical protein
VKDTFPIFVPVHKRLIAEFIAKREEILKAYSLDRLPPETEEKLKEIDVMLQGLAAQELPN